MFISATIAGWHGRLGTMLDYGLAGSPVPLSGPIGRIGETSNLWLSEQAMSAIELAPRLTISVRRGHGSPPQCEAAQHVVGECEPQQHGAGLVFAAHRKPREAHAARPGIGAFGLRALLVELFAGLAGHAPAPIRYARFVVAPRRKGIGAMLAVHRRAPQFDAVLMGPFDVVVLGKTPIHQVIRRPRRGGC